MINYTEIENILKTWIKTVTGLGNGNVISQDDNHARPQGQYATIKILDPLVIGHDTYNATNSINDTVNLNYVGVRKLMVTVNIYRDDAMQKMAQLESSFNRLDTQIVLRAANLGIINSSDTRDLTSLVNDIWEQRRQADFFFYAEDKDTINVEAITKIAGKGFDTPYLVE
jgi:hypothetical protein